MLSFGSLFAGAGGFDVGLERSGARCKFQVEIDPFARKVLAKHWPDARRHDDVKTFPPGDPEEWRVDVICGGDPCPFRSRGSSIHGTESEDLWPEFLRVVSVLRPLWVLREHVPAADADACAAMLADAGYSVVVVEMDGSQITGQRRRREFLCGVRASSGICPIGVLSQREDDPRNPQEVRKAGPLAACLTTHRTRFDGSDNYVLEPGRGLRILDSVERERLQGFDDGWTAGVSERQRARLTGNALITHKAEWLGRRVMANA
jgi:DNA (cytosine-5)-methyltransferase 1